jgi:hypothetical protein
MVIGNKQGLDVKALQKRCKIKELDVDYLFNYVDNIAVRQATTCELKK